jgi:hypothetical protein
MSECNRTEEDLVELPKIKNWNLAVFSMKSEILSTKTMKKEVTMEIKAVKKSVVSFFLTFSSPSNNELQVTINYTPLYIGKQYL